MVLKVRAFIGDITSFFSQGPGELQREKPKAGEKGRGKERAH